MSEMEEIRLEAGRISGKIGESNDIKEVKFKGRHLTGYNSYHGQTSSGDDRGTSLTLYETEKGKFLLYTENWSRWQGEDSHKKYKVFNSLKELEGNCPDQLIYEAKEKLGMDPAEELNV